MTMSEDTSETTRQPLRERPVSRRDALRGLGRGVTLAGSVTAVSATAAARSVDTFANAKPESVSISHDTEFLNRYRPLLDTSNVPFDNRPTLYGWKLTNRDEDVETVAAVYCCEYAVQKDVLTLTSHPGDHEWIYVFVDPDSGEVTEVSYCAYHWLRGYVLNPPVYGGEGEDHPMFRIAPTYHNYIPMTEETDSSVLFEPKSLGDYSSRSGPVYQWLENGMAEDMEPGAVHEPWLLNSSGPLDAWWRQDTTGINMYILDAWQFAAFTVGIGIAGSENASFGDAEPS